MDSVDSLKGLRIDQCEPADWYVVFDPFTRRRWLHWLALGKYKHVSCFGFIERAQSWVFFDFHLDRSRILVVGDHEADILIGEYSHRKTVVRMAKPLGQELKINMAVGAWCVPAVAHIIGLPTCALRPDALFRQCLANGGEIMGREEHGNEAGEAAGRS